MPLVREQDCHVRSFYYSSQNNTVSYCTLLPCYIALLAWHPTCSLGQKLQRVKPCQTMLPWHLLLCLFYMCISVLSHVCPCHHLYTCFPVEGHNWLAAPSSVEHTEFPDVEERSSSQVKQRVKAKWSQNLNRYVFTVHFQLIQWARVDNCRERKICT